MPDSPSEPPALQPHGDVRGRHRLALDAVGAGKSSRICATPRCTVLAVPPVSWMVMVCSLSATTSFSARTRLAIWLASQPRPTMITAAKLGCRA
jgi:hypothetical protein